MMRPSPMLGAIGIVPDLGRDHPLPLGAWADAMNIRFKNNHMKRIKDAVEALATEASDATWMQLYIDDLGPRIVYGTPTKLYRLNIAGDAWDDVTNAGGDYQSGEWHSFPWGEGVIFNNGVDVPQILTAGSSNFVDLPNWGLLTSGQKAVTAKSLRPFENVLVALNVTIDGVDYPNMVWWSRPAVIDNNDADFNQPSWDYEDPATLSGFNYVGVDSGVLVDSLTLDTSHMIYSTSATYAMQFIGGRNVFGFREALDYGLARLGAVAQYENFHFVIGFASIYRHDGSVVKQIADGRVEDEFYDNIADFDMVRCTQDVSNKEIHTIYKNRANGMEYLIFNYDDDTWSKGQAITGGADVVCMAYGQEADLDAETYATVTTTYATEQRTYAEVTPKSEGRRMYWLTTDALNLAEESTTLDPNKEYFAESGHMAFTELGEDFTIEKVKRMGGILPQIEGEATTRFTFTRAKALGRATTAGQRVRDFDPTTQEKVKFRASARYIIMRAELIADGWWEMLTMGYDVRPVHGR